MVEDSATPTVPLESLILICSQSVFMGIPPLLLVEKAKSCLYAS